ncbi:MAG: type II toxin-antitoxin system HipA family toxin [Comamonadaceae bacterium]|nr:MAG: type II toxin-antitoxin system HipA family toxin [Comamonadaceae bacterium]
MPRVKKLIVTTPQGESGELHHEARYVFNYTTKDPRAEIALGMPLRAQSYASQVLPPILEMNRPEGFLLQRLHEALLKHGGADDMRLLAAVGGNTIGRVTLHEPGAASAAQPAMSLDEILRSTPSDKLFDHLLRTYIASGVSGIQPKVLVPEASRITVPQPTLIVKASGATPFLTQNEFVCMEAGRKAGIRVPEFSLSSDGGLFVTKRFDRVQDGDGLRSLGFEDMVVVMGKTTARKYEGSYENIAKAIRLYGGTNAGESLHRLFEYLALSVMVRNGDAHLKNFGVLYEYPARSESVTLAPLYDVVTTTAYDVAPGAAIADKTLALKLGTDRRFPRRDALLRFGREVCHVSRPDRVVERIAEGMRAAWREHQGLFTSHFAARMHAEWEEGLRTTANDGAGLP